MAAPQVAGAIALIYESAKQPVSIQEIRSRLLQACRMPAANEKEKFRFGTGILDIEKLFSMNQTNHPRYLSEEYEYSWVNRANLSTMPMESLVETCERKIPELTNDNLEQLFESLPSKITRNDFNLKRGDIVVRRQYGHHDGAWYGIVEYVRDNEAYLMTKRGARKIKLGLGWELRKLRPDYDFVDREESVYGEDLDVSVQNFTALRKDAGKNQISVLYKKISAATCLKHPELPDNPLIGVTKEMLTAVYNAHPYHNAITTPDILMAIWKKEGSDFLDAVSNWGLRISASRPDHALTLFRSKVYFVSMGMDALVHYIAVPGQDNRAYFTDADASDHETAFAIKMAELIKSGFLKRNIGHNIDSGLKVREIQSGEFEVTPTLHFYVYSLLAMDALFRQHEDQLKQIPGYGGVADLGLIYMHWNMGHDKMVDFMKSANEHRKEKEYLVNGNPISVVDWAFNFCPKSNEWPKPRKNAIIFRYFTEVFKLVFV